jgi:hypothetical protein
MALSSTRWRFPDIIKKLLDYSGPQRFFSYFLIENQTVESNYCKGQIALSQP